MNQENDNLGNGVSGDSNANSEATTNASKYNAKNSRNSSNKGRNKSPKSNNFLGKNLRKRQQSSKSNRTNLNDKKVISERANIRRFSCKNLSTAVICAKFTNQNVIVSNFRNIKDNTINLKFTIKPIKSRLRANAQVWARKLISSQELYLKGILNAYPKDWQSLLENTYIYDYFRSILYAVTNSRVAEYPTGKISIIGHAVAYHALLKPSHTFQHNGYYVKYQYVIDDDDLSYITKMAESFSFIKDYMSTSPRFYLENEIFDRILSGLKENISGDNPELVMLDYDFNGSISSYLSKDQFSMANSFYSSKSKSNDWFYAHNSDTDILNNSSLFGKNVFVTSLDDDYANRFYERNQDDDEFYLAKYEVSALCGSMYPNYIGVGDAK